MKKTTQTPMPVPETARVQVRTLYAQYKQAEANFSTFLSGLAAGMGLVGDYQFDIGKMKFVLKSEKEA